MEQTTVIRSLRAFMSKKIRADKESHAIRYAITRPSQANTNELCQSVERAKKHSAVSNFLFIYTNPLSNRVKCFKCPNINRSVGNSGRGSRWLTQIIF